MRHNNIIEKDFEFGRINHFVVFQGQKFTGDNLSDDHELSFFDLCSQNLNEELSPCNSSSDFIWEIDTESSSDESSVYYKEVELSSPISEISGSGLDNGSKSELTRVKTIRDLYNNTEHQTSSKNLHEDEQIKENKTSAFFVKKILKKLSNDIFASCIR